MRCAISASISATRPGAGRTCRPARAPPLALRTGSPESTSEPRVRLSGPAGRGTRQGIAGRPCATFRVPATSAGQGARRRPDHIALAPRCKRPACWAAAGTPRSCFCVRHCVRMRFKLTCLSAHAANADFMCSSTRATSARGPTRAPARPCRCRGPGTASPHHTPAASPR